LASDGIFDPSERAKKPILKSTVMNTKVYVDNLAAATTGNDLRNLFSAYGNVAEVNVPIHRTNGRPRGFGFVTMTTPEGARAAIRALHGKEIGTHNLIVSEAWLHEERTSSSGSVGVPGAASSHLDQAVAGRDIVNFKDAQLQQCYDRNLLEAGDASGDLRRVRALIATHDLFQMLEGAHSARVHETMEQLLSARLRPGLRRWYQRSGAETDSATVEFRERLSQLAAESLENVTESPDNRS